MPTYDYRCPEGHEFELFQRMTDPAPEVCEVCGEGPLERVLYPVAVHFKGAGFYSTDYGRGGKKKDAAKDGDPSAGEPKDGKKGAGEKPSTEKSSSEKTASTSSDS